jgi:hypothetical protein
MDIPDGAKETNKLQSRFISLVSIVQQNCNLNYPFNSLRYQKRGEGEKMCKQTIGYTTYYNKHVTKLQ